MDDIQFLETSADVIAEKLAKQRAAYLAEGGVSSAVRKDRLRRAQDCLFNHKDEFIKLISDDFGNRSAETTLFADVAASAGALRDAIKHVDRWMKPSKRSLQFPLGLLGAKAAVVPQPKGVVGLITPWNFPLTMVFVPLAQMLAAGNRVMIKPSEATPRTSKFLAEVVAKYFDETEVTVITGSVPTSQAFSSQPFDHLMFTGAPAVGKLIMRAASENLTPVTLELGGKSPVVVGKSADLSMVAERVATMKHMNAGQICLAPDYVNIDKARRDEFVDVYTKKVESMYPAMLSNDQYTSIISKRHRERLEGYIEDAREKGADVRIINPADEDFAGQNQANKLPSALILDPSENMKVMQEEIFGPILPVRTYESTSEVIEYVNDHERPLALYYFGQDAAEEHEVLTRTTSGGVTVNDVLWHGAHETLPFGGVGNSGIGHYHGYEGFLEFSHQKSVLKHPKLSIGNLLGVVPPYTSKLTKNIERQLKR
ncbi:coniferyl aldehyde dehydrogenase [Kordiimonas laminariae]|uniref:coniferyl aldehyde dehydrogenase n=1 Tax=Kordiimonas laminariae TaxID=2917717 RepID=UPI001FF39C5C|nr:coniferyl aldehyde dehydrogenase [Kordiimonas laminariae]MCK0069730.1 coniferyl aldehyde dehydrogenase [Kordiimonas laminariae]